MTKLMLIQGDKESFDAFCAVIAKEQGLVEDELTGLYVPVEPFVPMFVIVPNGQPGIAVACAGSRKAANEKMLAMGISASHHVEEC